MILLVGLGNPGKEGTRHNIGFDVIDSITKEYSFDALGGKIFKNKYDGDLYRGELSVNNLFSLFRKDSRIGKDSQKGSRGGVQGDLESQKGHRSGVQSSAKNSSPQVGISQGGVSEAKGKRAKDSGNNILPSLDRVEFMNNFMTSNLMTLMNEDFVKNHMNSHMNEGSMNCSASGSVNNSYNIGIGDVGKSMPVYLLKPATYMNASGVSVNKFLRHHKIGTHTTENGEFFNIIVFHDEMDRKLRKYRVMTRKSSHNGLKNVDSHIGLNYYKFGLGIERPASIEQVSNYVLSRFLPNEREAVDELIEKVADNLPSLLSVFL